MRKLTVKNFSVIKEAELEFGKITVLIGPQSSGKSLLCKLAFFLGQVVPELIENCLKDNFSYASLIHRIGVEFKEKFPVDSWSGQKPQIQYQGAGYTIRANDLNAEKIPMFDFGEEFSEDFYNGMLAGPGVSRVVIPSRIRKRLEEEGAAFSGPPIVEESVYIPTGRSFYSTTNRAFAMLSTKNLDWITQRYAPEFDAEYRALRESYDSGLGLLFEFGRQATQILRGRVIHAEGRLTFKSTDDEHHLPFELLSSGTLELLPLINNLSQLARSARFPNIPTMPVPPFGTVYIEEPELSVFPDTQNDLVRLLAWLASEESLRMSYAITTHSPYILTAFNTLIEAWRVGNKEGNLEQVAAIIPEKYWVSEDDFAAYSICDGKLTPIFSKEEEGKEGSGLIDGDFLDSVSDQLGSEFDKLLDIEYAN